MGKKKTQATLRTTEMPLEEIIEKFKASGMDFMIPDTEVDYYTGSVWCGHPTEFESSDIEKVVLPKEFLGRGLHIIVNAAGNSMNGSGIENGDQLLVELDTDVVDGDIVVASINNEMTVKALFHDADGQAMLVPTNDAYEPIVPNDFEEVRIWGKVTKVFKESLRVDAPLCKRIMKKAGIKVEKGKEITERDVVRAVNGVKQKIKYARQWFAVFRVLVDKHFYQDASYINIFVDDMERWFPDEDFKLNIKDLSRMNVGSFSKCVSRWNRHDAPVTGIRFVEYVAIAQAFESLL